MTTPLEKGVERNVRNVRKFTLEHPGAQKSGRHQCLEPVELHVREWTLSSNQTGFPFHTSPFSCWLNPCLHKHLANKNNQAWRF